MPALNQQVLLPREDGCNGPLEVSEFFLIGQDVLYKSLQALDYCSKNGLLPGVQPRPFDTRPPLGIVCEDIPEEDLIANFVLIGPDSLIMIGDLLHTCQVNYRDRLERIIEKEKKLKAT